MQRMRSAAAADRSRSRPAYSQVVSARVPAATSPTAKRRAVPTGSRTSQPSASTSAASVISPTLGVVTGEGSDDGKTGSRPAARADRPDVWPGHVTRHASIEGQRVVGERIDGERGHASPSATPVPADPRGADRIPGRPTRSSGPDPRSARRAAGRRARSPARRQPSAGAAHHPTGGTGWPRRPPSVRGGRAGRRHARRLADRRDRRRGPRPAPRRGPCGRRCRAPATAGPRRAARRGRASASGAAHDLARWRAPGRGQHGPVVGRRRPASTEIRLDLPAPLGPVTARARPADSRASTSDRARIGRRHDAPAVSLVRELEADRLGSDELRRAPRPRGERDRYPPRPMRERLALGPKPLGWRGNLGAVRALTEGSPSATGRPSLPSTMMRSAKSSHGPR